MVTKHARLLPSDPFRILRDQFLRPASSTRSAKRPIVAGNCLASSARMYAPGTPAAPQWDSKQCGFDRSDPVKNKHSSCKCGSNRRSVASAKCPAPFAETLWMKVFSIPLGVSLRLCRSSLVCSVRDEQLEPSSSPDPSPMAPWPLVISHHEMIIFTRFLFGSNRVTDSISSERTL